MKACILASGSPRRREILANLGARFEIVTPNVDETSDEHDPERLSELLAKRKGEAALRMFAGREAELRDRLVIASDTTVAIGGEILGKPKDAADAGRMLRLLAGRTHRVVSGIFLAYNGKIAVSHEVTEVVFAPMTDAEIEAYIASGEPFGKAGGYAIQGLASLWIREIRGDYFNVVGLPVHRMQTLCKETFGFSFPSSVFTNEKSKS